MTRFCPYPFFSDNSFVVLPVGHPLWREDGSVTYRAIADWSGHWGPIAIHYRLIWDCVPSSSPLTTRKDYGGGILTRIHTGEPICECLVFTFKHLVRTSQKTPTCVALAPSATVSTMKRNSNKSLSTCIKAIAETQKVWGFKWALCISALLAASFCFFTYRVLQLWRQTTHLQLMPT
jgi:hypothetical protein